MIDFHLHSNTSIDSPMTIAEIVTAAKQRGLTRICLTNHYEPAEVKQGDFDQSMTPEMFEAYHAEIQQQQQHLKVGFGVEMSYLEDDEDEIKRILSSYDFDYVLGSVHYAQGKKVASAKNRGTFDEQQLPFDYFNRLKNAIQSNLFDAIGHIDIFKKVMPEPDFATVKDSWYEIAQLLKKHDTVFEINTSREAIEDNFYPSRDIIKFLFANGADKITLGSDAHCCQRVGSRINDVIEFLRSIGVEKVYYFEQRQRKELSIV